MWSCVISEEGNHFQEMILNWDKHQKLMREEDNQQVRAKMLLDGQDFVFFFMHKNSVYGANVGAQQTFSVMKNPMDEVGFEEMSFIATNLSKAMEGEPKEEIFVYKQLPEIKVIQKNMANSILLNHPITGKDSEVNKKMRDIHGPKKSNKVGEV